MGQWSSVTKEAGSNGVEVLKLIWILMENIYQIPDAPGTVG